jgi:hypothetical protein
MTVSRRFHCASVRDYGRSLSGMRRQLLLVVLAVLSLSQWCRFGHNETQMVRRSQPQTRMNLIEHRSWLTIEPETQLGARSLCLIKAETEDTAFVAPSCDRFLNALVALSVPSPRPVGCDACTAASFD